MVVYGIEGVEDEKVEVRERVTLKVCFGLEEKAQWSLGGRRSVGKCDGAC